MTDFTEAERRDKCLLEQLQAAPMVTVLGIVGASGVSGLGSETYKQQFAFDAWKYPGVPIQNRKLSLRKYVSREEFRQSRKTIHPYAILEIQARVVESPALWSIPGFIDLNNPQGLLVDIVSPGSLDQELRARAQELQQPVTFHDPVFGHFTLNRRLNWYETQVSWAACAIQLSLRVDAGDDVKPALSVAHTLWQSQQDWNQRILQCAVSRLLPLKNASWLDQDEQPVTAEQFAANMKLTSVVLYPNGTFEFWHNDGGLFWKHAILVTGNLEDGPARADISG